VSHFKKRSGTTTPSLVDETPLLKNLSGTTKKLFRLSLMRIEILTFKFAQRGHE
jgi:hypothetical protein